jgi:hypothetical protein
MMQRYKLTLTSLALALCGCATLDADNQGDDVTSASGRVAVIEFDSYVYASPSADNGTIQRAIQAQVKSAIGALRTPEIAIQDRDALHNIDPATWRRETLTVASMSTVQRIRYHYRDTALLRLPLSTRATTTTQTPKTIPLTMLFGDYVSRADRLRPLCSDDATTAADSLWFHFTPTQRQCAAAIVAESDAITRANTQLAPGSVSQVELDRSFVTVRAELKPVATAPARYPEYDRLWGFGSNRTQLVVYAFFGVDSDLRNSTDNSLVEYMRFLATVRGRFPGFRVTDTRPYASLLDFNVDGQTIAATYDDITHWIVDNNGFPSAVGNDAARRERLKQQVIDRFAERWIYWDLPMRVTRGTASRDVTVQIRAYWGHEDGRPDWRQAARWRYLEGMWNGDVFLYQGHSHFGHGPLEPTGYMTNNFPADRYQIMLINSCVSFNYYDTDFLDMHPSGSRNLDMIVNGLPAYWTNMGEATGRAVIGLLDGGNKTWEALLRSMTVRPPWAPSGYDPIRAVNGELDNQFDPARGGPVSVTVR